MHASREKLIKAATHTDQTAVPPTGNNQIKTAREASARENKVIISLIIPV